MKHETILTKDFFKQYEYYETQGEITEQSMRDILAAITSNPQEIQKIESIFFDICKANDINPQAEIIQEFYKATQESQEQERKKQAIEQTQMRAHKLIETGDLESFYNEIGRELENLKTKKESFTNFESYMNECKNYNPDNDFKPSIMSYLPCPNGTISIIGARPAGGKSTVLVNIAREGIKAGRKVFLVNLEMLNKTVITNYALSYMFDLATNEQEQELEKIESPKSEFYRVLKTGQSTSKDFASLQEKAMSEIERILNKDLFIYDGTDARAIEPIITDIESRVSEGDIVLIDYIQKTPPPINAQKGERYTQVAATSNTLLNLAIKKQLVIICGAQLKRNDGKQATQESYRESGDIEQDAHNAVSIENENNTYYIKVLKAREGGAKYQMQKLQCIFKYLHIADDKEYEPTSKPIKKRYVKKYDKEPEREVTILENGEEVF